MLDAFELHFSTYMRTVERQILPLSSSGDKAQAEVLARGTVVADFRRAREAMNDLMDYGLDRAQRRQQNTVADYNRALWTVVGITLTISGLGASVAFFLARSITRPLNRVTTQFSRIAAGELDSPIESDRHDEIGELLRALGEMKSRLASGSTERHTSETALRESEERFRALFEGSPDAMMLTDPHDPVVFRRIVACNEVACRMNEHSREELMGQSVDVLHPESTQGQDFAELLVQLRREGAIAIEAVHRRKDGTLFPIETHLSLVTVGGHELILGIDRDITERKKAQEALRGSEESLAAAQRIAHLGNWDWDIASDTLCWSAEVYRIFALPPSGFEATYDAFMLRVHPEDRGLVQAARDAALHRRQPYSVEHRVVRPSGETRIVHEQAEVVRDETGRPVRMIGTVHDVTERSRAEQNRALLASLVESSEEAVIGQTLEGTILTWNSSAERLYGYSAEEAKGQHISILTPENQADEIPPILERISRGERLERLETTRVTRAGVVVEVSLTVSPIKDFAGRVVGAAVVAQGITERKQAERALRENEAGLRAAQRIARLGDWSVDLLTHELRWSEEYCRLLGYRPGEAAPSYERFMERVHPDARERVRATTQSVFITSECFELEFPIVHPDDTVRFLHERSEVVPDADGRPIAIHGIGHDVTERKHLEAQLEHQATHDALTGLPNRTLFATRLCRALDQRHRRGLSVLFLDLDGFKYVNDTLGHDAGDRLLIIAAQRVQGALRPGDTVARLGGDEFAVLLTSIGDRNSASAIADRIATSLREPLVIEGRETFVTASIGITVLGSERDARCEDILREADMAMYRAKTSGKGRYEMFTEDLGVSVAQRALLESELHRAIEREEFEVHYQRIVDLKTGRPVGYEALTRWRHPKRGLVAPGEFIGLAEETGLILPLGAGTLRQACLQGSEWHSNSLGPLWSIW